jgi:hypothetical protein
MWPRAGLPSRVRLLACENRADSARLLHVQPVIGMRVKRPCARRYSHASVNIQAGINLPLVLFRLGLDIESGLRDRCDPIRFPWSRVVNKPSCRPTAAWSSAYNAGSNTSSARGSPADTMAYAVDPTTALQAERIFLRVVSRLWRATKSRTSRSPPRCEATGDSGFQRAR